MAADATDERTDWTSRAVTPTCRPRGPDCLACGSNQIPLDAPARWALGHPVGSLPFPVSGESGRDWFAIPVPKKHGISLRIASHVGDHDHPDTRTSRTRHPSTIGERRLGAHRALRKTPGNHDPMIIDDGLLPPFTLERLPARLVTEPERYVPGRLAYKRDTYVIIESHLKQHRRHPATHPWPGRGRCRVEGELAASANYEQ